jgi:hypothetical protein
LNGLKRLPLFLVAAAGSAAVAYPSIFSIFQPTDDEGYMLVSLHSFAGGGHLYSQVFSEYGPFFFQFWGGLFSLLGLNLDHDTGRLVTLVVWVVVSLLVGFAVYRITDSVLLGICVQLLVFHGLDKFVNEPMHPGGLTCLLLAGIVLASTLVVQLPRTAWATIGAAAAGLVLTKVNVGGFAVFAIALACVTAYGASSRKRWVRPLLEAGCVALPVALMWPLIDDPLVRNYAAHVTLAIGAVVIGLRMAKPVSDRFGVGLRWLIGGFAGLAAASLLLAVILGTGPADLVDGVLLDALRHPDIIAINLGLPPHMVVIDLVLVACCAGFAFVARGGEEPSRRLQTTRAVTGIVAGLLIGLTGAGVRLPLVAAGFQSGGMWALALAWVALLPTVGEQRSATRFARLLLPALAVLEGLHAYPVAGTQVQWSSFLMLPVGAIAFDNGRRDLGILFEGRASERLAFAAPAIAVCLIVVAALIVPFDHARDRYDAGRSLEIAGSERLHLPAADASQYEQVVALLQANCDSFLTLPGENSFYVWSGIDPPTGYNAPNWMLLFDESTQQAVVDAADRSDRLCLVRQPILASLLPQGRPIPQRPLYRFVQTGFEPVETIGFYDLLRRAGD